MLTRLQQRVATLPRDGRDTLFLLAVIGWILLPQLGRLPPWCSALAATLLAWRAWLAWTSRPLPRPRWLLALLVPALAATAASHGSLLGRDAGVTLIVLLLALKTLELRARRDAFVVFFLGFFTLLTNFFFSQSLATTAAMGVGLLGLLTGLVNAQLPVGRPPLAQAARTAAAMTLLGAPVMVALFLLFPRLPPMWGLPSDAMSGRSGLSAHMQVGNVADLALDDGVALRVRFEGAAPPVSERYFRGPVLGRFDGRNWAPLYPDARLAPSPASVPARGLDAPLDYEVALAPGTRRWLLTLDATLAPPRLPATVLGTPELEWRLAQAPTGPLRYRARAHLQWQQAARARADALPLDYRELPPGYNPRTLRLAEDIVRAHAGEGKAALVDAALDRLRHGGYGYTLAPGRYGRDTADEFWFERKQGFCEHIASAFAVLMRAMGIPARIVTGYQGGEPAPDGWWIVRHSDAHAWVEVWLAGRGWLRVDPTAAVAPARTGSLQRLRPPPGALAEAVGEVSPGLLAALRGAWDALDRAWNQGILHYDQSRQLDLLRHLGFESPTPVDLARALLLLVAAVAAAGAAWALWERHRQDPWLRLLGRARRRLDLAGLALPATHGPRQLATAALARFGPAAQPLAHWLLRLEAQRYAREPACTLGALRREFRQLPRLP